MPPNETNSESISHERRLIAQQVSTFSGPIPPPSILQQYNQVIPGAAERILKMAEAQSEHRRRLEERVIFSDVRNSKLGLVFGFIITITAIIVGAFLILKTNNQVAGGLLSVGSIATLAGVFVYGSRQRTHERLQREESRKTAVSGRQ